MYLTLAGISHQSAPVALRERFAFSSEELPAALEAMAGDFAGVAIVSTCNRTEAYISTATPPAAGDIVAALSRAKGEKVHDEAVFYHLAGLDAAAHLFRVAGGIESLVVGEHEILGQVRAAFTAATGARTTTPTLARLFHTAIRTGRRARAETEIGSHGLSVSATAVALVRKTLGDLRDRTVLIVGAGEAARLAALALGQQGAGRLLVTTRTFEHAQDIALELGASAHPFADLARLIADADIVITSTAAPGHVISAADVAAAMAARPARPLAIVDIAVPRDVEPEAGSVANVHLFDIDDLEAAAETNRQARALEVPAVEAIVAEELARFGQWLEGQKVEPTVAAIERAAEATRRAEVERTLKRLPDLTDNDRDRLDAMTKAIVKRLLHGPVARLRKAGDGPEVLLARELFRLDADEEDEP